jgi:hypothetical protein
MMMVMVMVGTVIIRRLPPSPMMMVMMMMMVVVMMRIVVELREFHVAILGLAPRFRLIDGPQKGKCIGDGLEELPE